MALIRRPKTGLTRDQQIEQWVKVGVKNGWVVESGHMGFDQRTFVPTLVLQTDAVKALQQKGLDS